MIFRARHALQGGHVHMRVFVAPTREHTFAKLGDLVMAEADFDAFRNSVRSFSLVFGDGWEFVDEEDDA